MQKYSFSKPGKKQKIQVTSHCLSKNELEAVVALASREAKQDVLDSIFEAAGRGITIKSPDVTCSPTDYQFGRFDGLQVIGAGGNLLYVRNGFFPFPEEITIAPVDAKNHAGALERIIQQRKIDDTGVMRYFDREYAPLHGMDKKEAQNRAKYTTRVRNVIEGFDTSSQPTTIIAPKLALEGYFPDLKDIYGDNLHFQAYRVPLTPRVNGQFSDLARKPNKEAVDVYFRRLAKLGGKTMRAFHSIGLAYMDGHVGNMALVGDDISKSSLYATDLGSMLDISKEKFADRYKGFDAFTFLHTCGKLINLYLEYVRKDGLAHLESREGMQDFTYRFLEGYFAPEFSIGKAEQNLKMDSTLRELSKPFYNLAQAQQVQPLIEGFERVLYTFQTVK